MKRILLTILMLAGIGFLSHAQSGMEKMEPMVGIWQGDGWFMDQSGARLEFTQEEEITRELGNSALLIKGKGTSNGRIVHNAMAIVMYDSATSTFNFHSFLADGRKLDTQIEELGNGKYEWGFETPRGQIKYSIEINDDKWYEKGEFSPDGSNWFPFIEFNLTKLD